MPPVPQICTFRSSSKLSTARRMARPRLKQRWPDGTGYCTTLTANGITGQGQAPVRASCSPHISDSGTVRPRSEEHTSELQSPCNLVCRLLLEKKKKIAQSQRRAGHPTCTWPPSRPHSTRRTRVDYTPFQPAQSHRDASQQTTLTPTITQPST